MSDNNRVWRLRKRPVGEIADDVLSFEQNEPIPGVADGQLLVRLNYLSLDPTNRGWMNDTPSYLPPVDIGAPMRGIVCGTVVASMHVGFSEGDRVSGLGVWADYQIMEPPKVSKMGDLGSLSLADAFGVFAVVGPTAYFGLLDIGQPQSGQTVVVSGAGGAVGSIAGQIAGIQGCRVVGITGSSEKCHWITDELGFDAAIDYKSEEVPAALSRTCPDGIDVYFDNVGGPILDACLQHMNLYGRVPTCGLISRYNADGPVPGPSAYPLILLRRLKVQGYIVLDYTERYPEAVAALRQWMQEGKLKVRIDMREGLENAVEALRELFSGGNMGKLMLHVAET
ncbi:MAG: NADP-dependent oxidoreductase [Candidatus Latescibacterota bacterium]|nr:NADP-dependent oxidoreductase [Candidatus Latescibacterota bacterium]